MDLDHRVELRGHELKKMVPHAGFEPAQNSFRENRTSRCANGALRR